VTVSKLLAICGVIAPVLFLTLLIVAGSLRPGYDQLRNYISPLGVGPNAAIQNVNFIVVGVLMIGFVLGLHRSVGGGRGSKTGPALLGAGAMGFSALGFFPTCPGWCASGTIHSLLFFIVVTGAVVGLPVFSRRLNQDDQWKSYVGYSISTAIVALASFAAILMWATADSKTLAPTGLLAPWAGLLQRIFAGTSDNSDWEKIDSSQRVGQYFTK